MSSTRHYLNKLFFVFLTLGLFFIFPTNTVDAATFDITPSNASLPAECPSSFDIFANASGESSNSADMILFYNPAEINIIDSNPSLAGKQIQTGNAYTAYASNEVNQSLGRIRMTAFSIGNNLTENKLYARIEFESKPGITSTDFTFRFDGIGETLDSNIANSINSLDLLTSVTNGTVTFTSGLCDEDILPPNYQFLDPISGASGVPLDSNVQIRITDNLSGVDLNTLEVTINGITYNLSSPELSVSGDSLNYTITINPSVDFPPNAATTIFVRSSDFAGNTSSATNFINVPPGTESPTFGDPTDELCDCNDPLGNFLDATFQVQTGSPTLDELLNSILNELGVAGVGALLSGLALLLRLLTSVLPFISLLNTPGSIFSIFSFFLGKKHKKPWGIILDAGNNQPIPFATCRLYVAETTTLITQTVSDIEGRYGFVMSPGKYRLEIKQSDYVTFTENFEIAEDETVYLRDVRLVPSNMIDDLSGQEMWKRRVSDFWKGVKRTWKSLQPALIIVGFLLSILSIIVQPTLLNYIILALYAVSVVLLIIAKLTKPPKFSSIIDSSTNLRIPYAVIKFYDLTSWELIDTQVSNANGQFDFREEEGDYGILVAVRGYKFPSQSQRDLEVVENKYNSMLKAHLLKGRNRINLFLDPSIDGAVSLSATLEPATKRIAQPSIPSKTDSKIKDPTVTQVPEFEGNLPTPFS